MRFLEAAARPPVWRRKAVVPTYWWDGHPNFGDGLTPWLLPRYGIIPVHRLAGRARLAGVGSIIEFLPTDYTGAIWGSGLIRDVRFSLLHAEVLAVRGPLTRERIGAPPDVPLGDPGLLVSRWLEPSRAPRSKVGLLPHGHHRSAAWTERAMRRLGADARLINVHQSPAKVARQISGCRTIVTSSLHGLVVADSYGIPAIWTTLEPALDGGEFKFHDYEAGVTPGRTRFVDATRVLSDAELDGAWSPPRDHVNSISDTLEAALTSWGRR